MRRLRDIVFRWFLGGVLLLFTAFTAITIWTGEDLLALLWQRDAGPMIRYASETMVDAYESRGAIGLQIVDNHTSLPAGVTTIVLNAEGKELRGNPINPALAGLLDKLDGKASPSGEILFKFTPDATLAVVWVNGKQARAYKVGYIIPDKPFIELPIPVGAVLIRVGLGLCIAAAVCYWLAHHLTMPLTRLREAARRFAGGDLSARGGDDSSLHRVTEIHELVLDFDEMAARIETLMEGQRRLLLDVSHELRTPLTRLALTTGIARRYATPDILPSLDRIEREAEKLNQLVSSVIAINRIEANGQPISRKSVNLSALVTQVVDDARIEANAQEKSVQLLGVVPCLVEGDSELLSSAIENVLRNAIRHTGLGTTVCVRMALGNDQVRLDVSDEGPGIPEDSISKIFDPFFRVQKGREAQSGGIGLGLTIADRAIRLHGGRILPQNRPEGGLEMAILIPNTIALCSKL